ncbi:MAG: radical SAM protein [Dysgonamonadaceae bacterium]|jgi:MoaA/NifB/PqqE/SkfB family radical SAM enzyme|nr:radical SAM protein [Dysgonamonadaceae bacterium]
MKNVTRKIRSFFRVLRRALFDGLMLQGRRKQIPTKIIIEPTNLCNLKCSCCPHGNHAENGREKGLMSREMFVKILANIDLPVKEICLYLHGEPFLNNNLDFFVSQTDKLKGVLTSIYSNGYNIDIELLNRVLAYKKTRFSFSMDIINKEEYEQIRKPAVYKNAIESLQKIDAAFAGHNRKYELNIIANGNLSDNKQAFCNQLFSRFLRLRKISFTTKFPWPEHFYVGDLSGHIAKKRTLCEQITGGISVYWNGDATICSYDFSGKLLIGNLLDTSLSKLYNSSQARRIRKYHFFHRFVKLPVCKECLLPRFTNRTTSFNRPKETITKNE